VPDLGGAGQGRNDLGLLYLDGRGVRKDYLQAYMWFKLSRPDSNPNLSIAAAHMTPEQIAEAERLAAQWNTHHPQPNCDAFQQR
jgi:TPR repeat protein